MSLPIIVAPFAVIAVHDWNAVSYDVAFASAAAQLDLGLHVVLDCPLARPALYLRALEIAGQVGEAHVGDTCMCTSGMKDMQHMHANINTNLIMIVCEDHSASCLRPEKS